MPAAASAQQQDAFAARSGQGYSPAHRSSLAESTSMRIICPNCQAKYEIPDTAIPADGREVQCANCSRAWYQLPLVEPVADQAPLTLEADSEVPPEPEAPEPAPEAPAARADESLVDTFEMLEDTPPDIPLADTETGAPSPRREMDPSILSFLEEEADREVLARTRPEEVLPPAPAPRPAAPSEGASARLARLKAAEAAADTPPMTPDPEPAIEDLGERIRAPQPPLLEAAAPEPPKPQKPGRDLPVPVSPTELMLLEEKRNRAGFRLGFAMTAGVACAGLGLYLIAPHVAVVLPQGTPYTDLVIEHGNRVQAQLIDTLTRLLSPPEPS